MSKEVKADPRADSKIEDKPAEAGPAAPEGDYKQYRTSDKGSVLFDILIKGENVYGYWGDEKKHIYFNVPKNLTEWFEKHWHFTSGNVVAAS